MKVMDVRVTPNLTVGYIMGAGDEVPEAIAQLGARVELIGPDDLVALMTPEMAGSDIALGRKTDVIERIVSEEWWGRRARVADQDQKELQYERCFGVTSGLANQLIARRREKLTLDALDDLHHKRLPLPPPSPSAGRSCLTAG